MRSRSQSQPHRWDMQLGELSISGRIVGYVYFRASRTGVEWNADRWWRLSKVQDAWVETQEWFIAPDGGLSSYTGENVGPEDSFENFERDCRREREGKEGRESDELRQFLSFRPNFSYGLGGKGNSEKRTCKNRSFRPNR